MARVGGLGGCPMRVTMGCRVEEVRGGLWKFLCGGCLCWCQLSCASVCGLSVVRVRSLSEVASGRDRRSRVVSRLHV